MNISWWRRRRLADAVRRLFEQRQGSCKAQRASMESSGWSNKGRIPLGTMLCLREDGTILMVWGNKCQTIQTEWIASLRIC